MLSCQSEQHGGESSEGSQSMLHSDKKAQTTLFAQRALQEQRRLKPPDTIIACPRCQSLNTKFCYYNNYSLTQPRHFCKNCRRYWTAGGTLRNVPVGGGCRKNKRAKRNNELNNVLTSGESVSVSRNDGTSSALHPTFNPGSASTSANYYDHQYEDAAKIALARVQHAVRAGPSGVSQSMDGISSNGHVSPFHVSHGSHSTGMSHSAQSSFEAPVVPSIISLGGYYQPQVKPEVAVLANGDLSAIFESQSYRAAAAAAAASGGVSALGEGGITYNIDMEALNNMNDPGHVDVQWRLHHQHVQQQQAAAAAQKQQQQAMWGEEDQGHREGRQPLHNAAADEKGLMESLRQAKGKSAIAVSPSSGHEQAAEGPEVSRPLGGVPNWQQGPPESMQSLEQQDNAFWSNQNWAPLDIHALNPPSNSQII